ncbi:hypothetical protein FEM48_Zijuj07G0065300 [Ziziphus jujuba var. spinosa]|uniref:ALOG domain-containing protein n=1 Tax=Ziziphus jujuba var. spinosa TaxID=714518 RepID=A0A978V314_ZIZJJ|nr:hypothetical protein FEM48_Zijuj07G0065300 [Ziziphus jujuba var. spinosa]
MRTRNEETGILLVNTCETTGCRCLSTASAEFTCWNSSGTWTDSRRLRFTPSSVPSSAIPTHRHPVSALYAKHGGAPSLLRSSQPTGTLSLPSTPSLGEPRRPRRPPRAAFEEHGGRPEANPFAARAVRLYLRGVRDSQAKARGMEKTFSITFDERETSRSVGM